MKKQCYKEWDECFPPKATKEAKVNLHIQVVTEYVNLRGFAHAASWMENLSTSTNKKFANQKV